MQLTPDLIPIFVSDSFCRATKSKPSDFIGKPIFDLIVPKHERKIVKSRLKRDLFGKKTNCIVVNHVEVNNHKLNIRWLNIPIQDDSGKIVEICSIGTPVPNPSKDRRKSPR